MSATWKQYEGQAVDGIPLLQFLGGSDESAVYLGELAGSQCALKLVPAEDAVAQIPLARWQQASKLSHSHLAKIHQWGRAKLNGASFVYLAMEYGEEVLAGVDRPLTPKEAREMLTPAVSALQYLHSQKCAHGRVHPSNFLSVNDVLKLAGDSPLRFGERHTPRAKPSPYDSPELANLGVTAAGDVWSLGVTLVEALTKQLPDVEADPVKLPDALKPDSFREVAAGCLQKDPARRWSLDDVAQWLERGTVPAPKKPPRRYLVPAAVAAALVILGIIAYPHIAGTSASSRAPDSTSSAPAPPSAAPQTTPAAAAQPPSPPVVDHQPAEPPLSPPPAPAKAAKSKPQPATAPAVVANQAPDTPKEETTETAKASPPSPADVIPADVLQPVRPDVPVKARNTIHGKVPIFVRVETDASGAVSAASIESGGSSKYFANLALAAAKQWKFAPGDSARTFLLKFEFTHNADRPVSMQASRMK